MPKTLHRVMAHTIIDLTYIIPIIEIAMARDYDAPPVWGKEPPRASQFNALQEWLVDHYPKEFELI